MDPISNVDRLVLLLRQRLQERERAKGASRTSRPNRQVEPRAVEALAALEGVDERQFRRSLIQGLLSDQFGQGVINDAKFQQVVDRVLGALEDDPKGRELLDRISREMRAAAR